MQDDSTKPQSMQIFQSDHVKMAYCERGTANGPVIIWAHGWGHTHENMLPLVESLAPLGRHIVIDTPGFGASPVPFDTPENSWSSRHYADFMAQFITHISEDNPVIWIGHSFGCRIAVQLGAHYPHLMKSMVFIAGAGLKRRRTVLQTIILKTKIYLFKVGKGLKPFLGNKQFGSADYQKAGPMRGTLVKVVNENLIAEAAQIQCPVLLIYGENDTETPPEIGERYKNVINCSEMVHLKDQDHYTVLGEGRHPVAAAIKTFIKSYS
jgi:pimeloyl-ACP methyl ester carboxylesterase